MKFPQFTGPFLSMLGTIDLNYLSFGFGGLCGYKSVRKSRGLGIGPDSHRSSSEQRLVSSDDLVVLVDSHARHSWDFQNWPAWNKKVTKMRLNGQLAVSGEIHWKRWGVPVVSFIHSVEPTQRIKWAWRSLGMRAIRVWSVIPAKDGVFVQTEQIYAGLLALIFAPLMRLVLKHSLNDELFYLKHECENAKRIRRKLHQHDRVP
ncbi:MAG TPA: hypothetical protein VN850_05170 [Candidatus Acidoferrales bacterium]|nr:hypothetical protein [Candidatus Acidoferrales bacterium]